MPKPPRNAEYDKRVKEAIKKLYIQSGGKIGPRKLARLIREMWPDEPRLPQYNTIARWIREDGWNRELGLHILEQVAQKPYTPSSSEDASGQLAALMRESLEALGEDMFETLKSDPELLQTFQNALVRDLLEGNMGKPREKAQALMAIADGVRAKGKRAELVIQFLRVMAQVMEAQAKLVGKEDMEVVFRVEVKE